MDLPAPNSNNNNIFSHSSENGSFQSQLIRDLGPQFRILQLNIEGISRDKSEYLAKVVQGNNISIILLQETHTADANQLQ